MLVPSFLFNKPAPTELYTLSLHDALPIFPPRQRVRGRERRDRGRRDLPGPGQVTTDRKSTRLNSSHLGISYAVFCLKKKKTAEKYSISRPIRPVIVATQSTLQNT